MNFPASVIFAAGVDGVAIGGVVAGGLVACAIALVTISALTATVIISLFNMSTSRIGQNKPLRCIDAKRPCTVSLLIQQLASVTGVPPIFFAIARATMEPA